CFFFQAEDGIRDGHVTGVQTCALPISLVNARPRLIGTPTTSKYFEVVGVPIKRGRAFTNADRDTASAPVIVSQHLATTYWGEREDRKSCVQGGGVEIGGNVSVDGEGSR